MTDRAPVVLRALARDDVAGAVDWYRDHGGVEVALSLVDAVEAALEHLALHPAAGSPRYAHELGLPGLRSWRLEGFPYLVFYVYGPDHVDVWRVLHAHRDVPASLGEDDDLPDSAGHVTGSEPDPL